MVAHKSISRSDSLRGHMSISGLWLNRLDVYHLVMRWWLLALVNGNFH